MKVAGQSLPLTRMAGVLPFVRYLANLGAPVERFLREARIPAHLLERPQAPIALEQAYRFGEMACRAEGLPQLGLLVGAQSSLADLGPYGRRLRDSLTVHEYLRTGSRLIGLLNSAERFSLSRAAGEVRLYHHMPGGARVGRLQADLNALMITVAELRASAGPGWFPTEVSLAGRPPGRLPLDEAFGGARIRIGTGETYLALPCEMLEQPFRAPGSWRGHAEAGEAWDDLPKDLCSSLARLIRSLLPAGYPSIDLVSEMAGLTRRTLQRRLAAQGSNFFQLVDDTRMRLAAHWLACDGMCIQDIARELGYRDPSNFTRAFRRRTGVPPQTYRRRALERG